MFRFYITLALCLFTLRIEAQCQLTGCITDCANQSPVSKVIIELQGLQRTTFSDATGNFVFDNLPVGTYHLYLSKEGYKAFFYSVKIKNTGAQTLSLSICKEKEIQIEEITVTATRTPQKLKEVPIPVQIITKAEIAKTQALDFENFLENHLLGIHFTYEGGSPNINMLGFTGKYVLFLIDGKRMAGETFDNIDYQRINLDDIERIEIIKGASSSLYGSNAIGGVVNIITQKAQNPLQASAGYVYDTNIDHKANFSIGTKQKWGNLYWASFWKKRNPYILHDSQPRQFFYPNGSIKELPPAMLYIAGFTNYGISPKLGFELSPRLSVELLPAYYFSERNDASPDAQKVLDHYHSYSLALQTNYQLAPSQSVKLNAMYDRYDKFSYFRLLDQKEKKYQNTLLRADLQYNRLWNAKHSFVAGAELLTDRLLSFRFTDDATQGTRSSQTYALFAQQDWILSRQLTLMAGTRMDYHSLFKSHFTFRLSAMLKTDNVTFRGGYAGGFRSPTIKELYTNWYHPWGGGFQISGNAYLQPETSNNFNFSAEYQSKRLTLTAMTQYSVINDKIDILWSDTKDQINYVNFVGTTRVISSELSLLYRLHECFRLQGAYTFYDIEKRASESRPHVVSLKAEYLPPAHKKYYPHITLNGKYASATTIHATEESNTIEDYYTRYGAYWLWRLQASVSLGHHFSVSAGIHNLLDYRPSPVGFYAPITPGRSYYVGLKFEL